MYVFVLTLHSLVRWLVLVSLVFTLYRAYYGWFFKKQFSGFDNFIISSTVTVVHLQFMLGLWLYFISPFTRYFMHNFKRAIHQRDFRFFGMEHVVMMLLAITIITIGSVKAKGRHTDTEKFRTMAFWFTAGVLIILSSIPWPFSPFTSRPYFRLF